MKKQILTGLFMGALLSISTTAAAIAGTWQTDMNGWWYSNDDGTWPSACWQWIDGDGDGISECYYFDEHGYCLMDTVTPDGNIVNGNGAWTEFGKVKTKNSNPAKEGQGGWKQAYIEYLTKNQKEGWKYKLIMIDQDEIPELLCCGIYGSDGGLIYTFYEGQIKELMIPSYGLSSYQEKKNLFHITGGRMDAYFDYIYKIEQGEFIKIHSGDYGAEDNSNVKFSEDGEPIYRYYWDDSEVTKREYDNIFNTFYDKTDKSIVDNVYDHTYTINEIILQIQEYGEKPDDNFTLSLSQREIMQRVLENLIPSVPSYLPNRTENLTSEDISHILYGHLNDELYYNPLESDSNLVFDDYTVSDPDHGTKSFNKYKAFKRIEDLYGQPVREDMLIISDFKIDDTTISIGGADGDGITDVIITDYHLIDGKLYLNAHYTVTYNVSDCDTSGDVTAIFRENPYSFIGFTLESVN